MKRGPFLVNIFLNITQILFSEANYLLNQCIQNMLMLAIVDPEMQDLCNINKNI